MGPETDRRSFLSWMLFGLGAIFSAILGVPIVAYVIDPRHRKAPPSDFRLVEGISLDELALNQPRQGVIRSTRRDGWTLHPNDVIGRVWVIKTGNSPQDYLVFTTICPHLGCSVNLDAAGVGFACPCHGASFNNRGDRIDQPGHPNPAARGMDTLAWERDPEDSNRIRVKFENFAPTLAEKKVQS
jgi:Rieske Fe-S protein